MVHFGSSGSKFNASETHFMFLSKRHLLKYLTVIHTHTHTHAHTEYVRMAGKGRRGEGEGAETTIYIGFDTIVFNIRLVLKWVRQFESMLCGDQSGQSNDKERK